MQDLITGMLLPREHIASVEVRLEQPPDSVLAVISDFASAPAWRSDLLDVEVLSTGQSMRWRETTDWGTLTMALEESRPPTRLASSEFRRTV